MPPTKTKTKAKAGMWAKMWQSLPLAAQMGLLIGSVGRAHLLSLASASFSAKVAKGEEQTQIYLGQQLFAAAYEHNPLNGPLAAHVLNISASGLTAAFKTQLSTVANLWQMPPEPTLKRLLFLTQKGNKERIFRFLEEEADKDPKNLFWLEQIFDYSLLENEPDLPVKYLQLLPNNLAPLKNYLAAILYLAKAVAPSPPQSKETPTDENKASPAEALILAKAALAPAVAEFEANKKSAGSSSPFSLQAGMPIMALLPLELAMHIFFLLDEREKGLSLGLELLKSKPWHTNLALRLYDEAQNRNGAGLSRPLSLFFHNMGHNLGHTLSHTLGPSPTSSTSEAATPAYSVPSGKTSLLLYSFNNAHNLDKTLSSLASSAQYFYNITVLNNGSSDETSAVLQRFQQNIGSDIFNIVNLPVNIGAPAARNWLLTTPAVKNSDYSIYIDDGAVLPANPPPLQNAPPLWLCALNRALEAYPNAGAYGIKILDEAAPYEAQFTDLHLYPAQQESAAKEALGGFSLWAAALTANLEEDAAISRLGDFSLTKAHSQNVVMSDLAQQAYDMGQFDYIRPCISVTGCVHMFRSKDLLKNNGFNLSFSPSQYDDLERDLRSAKAGSFACYIGLAAAQHTQRTGRGRHMPCQAYGSGLANRYKLNAHFTNKDIFTLIKFQKNLLEADFMQKLNELENLL